MICRKMFCRVLVFCMVLSLIGGGYSFGAENKIQWDNPPIQQRLLSQGPVKEIPPEMVESIFKDYGVDLSGKEIMISGYQLPKGWKEATKGVKKLVATNGGGLKHDPATVLNAKIFENLTGIHMELIEMKESLAWPKMLSLLISKATDIDLMYSPAPALEIPHLSAAHWAEPVDELWPVEAQELFPKKMLIGVKGVDGRFYTSPFCLWGLYLYYRPSWLEKTGVEVPNTWQDLIVASKKLDEWAKSTLGSDYAGMVHSSANEDHLIDWLAALTYDQGKRIVRNGRPIVDPEAWKVMTDFWLKGGLSKSSINYQWSESPEVFARGKAGFVFTSGVYMKMYKDPKFASTIQGDWDVTLLPGWEGMGNQGVSPLSINTWLINPYISPEKKAAAKLWIDFQRSFQFTFHELYVEGNESSLLPVYDHPKVREKVMNPDLRKETVAKQIAEFYPPGFMDAANTFKEYLHKVIMGQLDPDTAREKIQAFWDDISF